MKSQTWCVIIFSYALLLPVYCASAQILLHLFLLKAPSPPPLFNLLRMASDCNRFKDMSAAMSTMAMDIAHRSVLLNEWGPRATLREKRNA